MDIIDIIKKELQKLGVETHPKFFSEFEDIVKNSGCEKEIAKKFISFINIAHKLKTKVVEHKQFEHPKGYKDLYSMKIKTNINLRILFSFKNSGEILLHSFFEKEGKNVTDYSMHAPVAMQRLKQSNKEK